MAEQAHAAACRNRQRARRRRAGATRPKIGNTGDADLAKSRTWSCPTRASEYEPMLRNCRGQCSADSELRYGQSEVAGPGAVDDDVVGGICAAVEGYGFISEGLVAAPRLGS